MAQLKAANVDECLALERAVRARGFFSVNESAGDVQEQHLPLMLGDYMLAVCTEDEMDSRAAALQVAYELYLRFLQCALRYKVSSVAETDVLRKHMQMDSEDSEARLKAWLLQSPREVKVSRTKAAAVLRKDMDMHWRPGVDAARLSSQYWRWCIDAAVLDVLERVAMLLRELELLEARSGCGEGISAGLPKERPKAATRIDKPFQLVRDRAQVRSSVFKSGHNLPTMTVDEYLALERQRGNMLSGGGAGSAADPDRAAALLEQSEALHDAETVRLRQWDEFTDSRQRVFPRL